MNPYKITVILMTLICSGAFASEQVTIDLFEYAQNAEAQEAWKPQAESPPAELTDHKTDQGKRALLLKCDFSRAEDRCYWDREVSLDLTRFGRFSIWVYAENPQAVRNGTIYLQSGAGWFNGTLPVEKTGWQKISLWKSDFRTEDSPAGWDAIKTIRLSFWKANDIDTVVAVDDLEATADDILIVLGDRTIRKNSSEGRSVQQFCSYMANLLEDSGLDFGVVNDTDVESGALSGCKLAIFPHNPDTTEQGYKAIERFVKSGGKIMLFYSLPEQLAKLLGIKKAGWAREEYPGQFSTIKLDTKAVEGLPDTIAQGSWNVNIPEPIGPETRIVGRWTDTEGKGTEVPAITVHPNGMYMGHVFMTSDRLKKKRMLLALFGELVPDMRPALSQSVVQSAGRFAGFEDFGQVAQFIKDNAMSVPEARRIKALNHLAESKVLLSQAEQASKSSQYGKTLNAVRKATEQLQEAFFRSFPSREGEFRALWCHSAFGIPGWDWDKAIAVIKENGFNAIIPNMLWGGLTYYPSDVLPVAEEVKEEGDQIDLCLKACRKYGVQIHVWKVNWNLSRAPKEFVERMRKEGRLQKDMRGNDKEWLCPSHPKNYKLEVDSMLEIVRKYDVDGIHFDYIRYPNRDSCYCSSCKERLEESRKIKIKNWPADVVSGEYSDVYDQWRCDQITPVVKSVSEQARKINPKIKISAAVFKDYPACRKTVGQDWKAWIDAGYLDFVCPMDYTANNDQFWNVVASQLDIVTNDTPVYPGIGASAPGLPPEQVARQIHIARNLGVTGFTIFNYDLSVATELLPALSKGLTSVELLRKENHE
ncbi:family 10 glycosylhydrolase [Candidatus Poribacteria bacterium]